MQKSAYLQSNRLLDKSVHWTGEVADPSHRGEDTRMNMKKGTS
jgi:hypothetical protein